MSGPPKDIAAEDLWRIIVESPRPSEVVDYPRKDSSGRPIGKLRIQVLSSDDHDEARLKAEYWLKEDKKIPSADLKNPSILEVYGDAVARHILAMACLKVDPIGDEDDDGPKRYPRMFQGPDDLGKIPANELTALFNAYTLVQHAKGPFEGSIESPEELDAWIERLTEGAAAAPLAQLSWHQLADLATLLAERVQLLSSADPASPDSSSLATSDATSGDSDSGTGSPGSPRAAATTDSAAGDPLLSKGDEVTMQQAIDMARNQGK